MKLGDGAKGSLLGIFIGLVFILGFVVADFDEVRLEENTLEEDTIIANSEEDIINNCKNMNLRNTSICLRDNIKPSFNYRIRDDTIKNFTEIATNGGDCFDYSMMYIRMAEELGFNATYLRNDGIKGVVPNHRWAIMWDSENYCRIDQLKVSCGVRK